jgi:hypothetical protein
MPGLQRQHGAGKETGEHHDRQRADADLLELLDDVVESRTGGKRCPNVAACRRTYSCTSRTPL